MKAASFVATRNRSQLTQSGTRCEIATALLLLSGASRASIEFTRRPFRCGKRAACASRCRLPYNRGGGLAQLSAPPNCTSGQHGNQPANASLSPLQCIAQSHCTRMQAVWSTVSLKSAVRFCRCGTTHDATNQLAPQAELMPRAFRDVQCCVKSTLYKIGNVGHQQRNLGSPWASSIATLYHLPVRNFSTSTDAVWAWCPGHR